MDSYLVMLSTDINALCHPSMQFLTLKITFFVDRVPGYVHVLLVSLTSRPCSPSVRGASTCSFISILQISVCRCGFFTLVVVDVEVDSLVQGLLSVVLNGHTAGLKSSSSIVPVGQEH